MLRHLGIDILVVGQVIALAKWRFREAVRIQRRLGVDGGRLWSEIRDGGALSLVLELFQQGELCVDPVRDKGSMLRDEKPDSVEAAIDGDVDDVPELPKTVALIKARRQLFQDGFYRATIFRARAWLGAAFEEKTGDGEPELVFARDEQRLGEECNAQTRDGVDGDVGRRQRALPIEFVRFLLPDLLLQFIQHVADAAATEALGSMMTQCKMLRVILYDEE